MANNRKAIRDALKAQLIAAATSAGSNVYSNRDDKYWKSELPAINISTAKESARTHVFPVTTYRRDIELTITIKVSATGYVDDDLDTLVAQVETSIQAGPSFGGTVFSTELTNTETSVHSENESDIGNAVLTYICQYIA